MTLEEITELTMIEAFDVIVDRIFDLAIIPDNETSYSLDRAEEKPFLERVFLNTRLNRPADEIFTAELEQYREELRVEEQARLDEMAAYQAEMAAAKAIRDAWLARVAALMLPAAAFRAGIDQPNAALTRRDIIATNDEALLSQLEVFTAELLAEQAPDPVALGTALVIRACNECIRIVVEFNIASGLTAAQKDSQLALYADAMEALRQWRPLKFKGIIESLATDEVLAPVALRDKLVTYLASEGL